METHMRCLMNAMRSDIGNQLIKKAKLDFCDGLETYSELFVVGLGYNKMKKNETRAQFESRIKDKLSKVFEATDIECCIDGGYDC